MKDIREGLAANLSTIRGLHVLPFVPDNPTPPMAVVVPVRVTYDTAFARGSDEYQFQIVLLVARASDRGAQDTLDAYLGGVSDLKTAIESDRTLGGVVADLRVTECTSYGPEAVGETQYLAATFAVQVVTL